MQTQIHQLWVADGLPNHPSRNMASIKSITVHTTGNRNPTATAEAHARFQYSGGGGRQASWHYTVDADEIWQSFKDQQMCWHTGTRNGNETSIGIEICVNDRDGFASAVDKTAWLVGSLLQLYGLTINDVRQHFCWSGKNCPRELRSGEWGLSWSDFLAIVQNHLAPLSEDEVDEVLNALTDAGINFYGEHWRGVLNGSIAPNKEWTKKLMVRVIDTRWQHFSPGVIGGSLLALLRT